MSFDKNDFAKLMDLIISNPNKGIEIFYNQFSRVIYSAAHAVCKNQDEVDQTIQNTLKKIWRNAKTIGEIENPSAWVYVVAINCAKDATKKKYDQPLTEDIPSAKDEFAETIERCDFGIWIEDLKEIEQEILIKAFIDKDKLVEIAKDLDRPLSTVTSIYYRALKKIKDKIEKK